MCFGTTKAEVGFNTKIKKIKKNYKLTSSNPKVAKVVNYANECQGIKGLSEGTTTIKIYSSLLKKTLHCKVTIKDAEIKCTQGSDLYAGNTYKVECNGGFFGEDLSEYVSPLSYASSNNSIATISNKGVLTAKKVGAVTITCEANNGKKYSSKFKFKKPGLNYKKLTTYCYTGEKKGSYTKNQIVAAGIKVKRFKSSNNNIAIVNKYGIVSAKKTGKCTITCYAKNGKKYKCALTVKGGKPWGAVINKCYMVSKSQLKKESYYKNLNKACDYGNVISVTYSYNTLTGKRDFKQQSVRRAIEYDLYYSILQSRYPNKKIESGGNDLAVVKKSNGSYYRTIHTVYYYVK